MMVEIVPCSHEHLSELANNLRTADRAEIESFGITVAEAVCSSYNACRKNKTILADGKVAACFGAAAAGDGLAFPWLLTTAELEKINPSKFYRMYKKEVNEMLETYSRLENYVDARYTKAVRLLEILGFSIGEPQPYGQGIFRKFSILRGS